ncbi:hypothetical protein Mpsy_0300 [Methanolobus psychrophilus R15]|nr:hypothetical protein Mpsy_0300 [Methanolobus psychrophilus R15]
MSENEERVFTISPLPPVLHGFRLRDVKTQNKVPAIPDSHAAIVE